MRDISFEIKIPKLKFSNQRKFQFRVLLSLAIFIGAFFAKQSFEYTVVGTLILIYFGFSIVWCLTSRIAAACALFFLICTPILLFFKSEALAETFAIYAYYFLVITVVNEILLLKRGDNLDSGSSYEPADRLGIVAEIFRSFWQRIKNFLN